MKHNLIIYGRSYFRRDYQWLFDDSRVLESEKDVLENIYRAFRASLESQTVDNGIHFTLCFAPIRSHIFLFALGVLRQHDRMKRQIFSLSALFFEKDRLWESEQIIFNLPQDIWNFWFGLSQDEFMQLDEGGQTIKTIELKQTSEVDSNSFVLPGPSELQTITDFGNSMERFQYTVNEYYKERRTLPFLCAGYLSSTLAKVVADAADFSGIQIGRGAVASPVGKVQNENISTRLICEIYCEKRGFPRRRRWIARCVLNGKETTIRKSPEFDGVEESLLAGSLFDNLVRELQAEGWTIRYDRGDKWFNVRLHKV